MEDDEKRAGPLPFNVDQLCTIRVEVVPWKIVQGMVDAPPEQNSGNYASISGDEDEDEIEGKPCQHRRTMPQAAVV